MCTEVLVASRGQVSSDLPHTCKQHFETLLWTGIVGTHDANSLLWAPTIGTRKVLEYLDPNWVPIVANDK